MNGSSFWTDRMSRGVAYGLAAAALFGLSTPLAKALVGASSPVMLAGLLYLGSGIGLMAAQVVRELRAPGAFSSNLPQGRDWAWLAATVFVGGVVGPVALIEGLTATAASTASLLLNLEGVFTALLAWFVFRENFDRRIAFGMVAIVLGGVVLAWTPAEAGSLAPGASYIVAACACWALDNNLTRKLSHADAVIVAGVKGLVAGSFNFVAALALGHGMPAAGPTLAALLVGFLGYGISLAFFVLALRELGTARAAAYFSVAPFFGAALAIVVQHDPVTWPFVAAAALMAVGVWLHVTERHVHEHAHEAQEHTHSHTHDEHHRHSHDFEWDGHEPHAHAHVHAPLVHSHAHYPDMHHRHRHARRRAS